MKKFGKYIFEIIAIFIGITASFLVDEWREDAERRKDLEANLRAIAHQLERDSTNSGKIILYFDSITVKLSEVFVVDYYKVRPSNWPVLRDNLTDLGVKMERNSRAYQSFLQFNLSKYLKDDSVLLQLNHYYGYWQPLLFGYENEIIGRQEKIEDLMMKSIREHEAMVPVFSGDFASAAAATRLIEADFNELKRNTEFANYGSFSILFYRYLKRLHYRYIDENVRLRKLIKRELDS